MSDGPGVPETLITRVVGFLHHGLCDGLDLDLDTFDAVRIFKLTIDYLGMNVSVPEAGEDRVIAAAYRKLLADVCKVMEGR